MIIPYCFGAPRIIQLRPTAMLRDSERRQGGRSFSAVALAQARSARAWPMVETGPRCRLVVHYMPGCVPAGSASRLMVGGRLAAVPVRSQVLPLKSRSVTLPGALRFRCRWAGYWPVAVFGAQHDLRQLLRWFVAEISRGRGPNRPSIRPAHPTASPRNRAVCSSSGTGKGPADGLALRLP